MVKNAVTELCLLIVPTTVMLVVVSVKVAM